MRDTTAPKDVIEQIAEDASLYLVPGSKYDCMIPFIWDDSRRTERHDEIVQGLRQIRGIVDAVVVSRPGMMVDASNSEKSEERSSGGTAERQAKVNEVGVCAAVILVVAIQAGAKSVSKCNTQEFRP